MHLSEAAAWRYIAALLEAKGLESGLCAEVSHLRVEGLIPAWTHSQMLDRVWCHRTAMIGYPNYNHPGFVDYRGIAGPRILMALLMAHEAEDEAEEAVE